jgi:hypothetical protein
MSSGRGIDPHERRVCLEKAVVQLGHSRFQAPAKRSGAAWAHSPVHDFVTRAFGFAYEEIEARIVNPTPDENSLPHGAFGSAKVARGSERGDSVCG